MTIMTPNGKFGLIKLHGMVSSPSPLQLAVAAGNLGMVKDITELYLEAASHEHRAPIFRIRSEVQLIGNRPDRPARNCRSSRLSMTKCPGFAGQRGVRQRGIEDLSALKSFSFYSRARSYEAMSQSSSAAFRSPHH